MGTPLQELWVDHYFDQLEAHVVWTVGALFDYVSGLVPRDPHWMGVPGLEWVFRLARSARERGPGPRVDSPLGDRAPSYVPPVPARQPDVPRAGHERAPGSPRR